MAQIIIVLIWYRLCQEGEQVVDVHWWLQPTAGLSVQAHQNHQCSKSYSGMYSFSLFYINNI